MSRISTLRNQLGVIAGGTFVAFAGSLTAQEALESAVQGDRALEARSAPDFHPQDEKMNLGPVQLGVGVSYSAEWNDNYQVVSQNAESDFIQEPRVNLRAFWPATRGSTLSFGLGLGYRKYWEHDNLDTFTVTPNSELAWDIPIEDGLVSLHDRIEYSQDVVSQPGLSGAARFPRLENTAGIRGQWFPNRAFYELGYDHYNFVADGGDFDYLTRSSEQFFARAAYQVGQVTRVGLEASGAITDYKTDQQGDNQNLSVGPFAEWQVTKDLRASLRGGYVVYFLEPGGSQKDLYQFYLTDPNNPPPIPPQTLEEYLNFKDQMNAYYFNIDVHHQLTDFISHSLSAQRSVQQGVNQGSQPTETLSVSYAISWAFHKNWTASVNGIYEKGSEPQFNVTEDYDRYTYGGSLSWRPADRLTLRLAYRYTDKKSDLSSLQNVAINRDYQQNSVTFSADYQF